VKSTKRLTRKRKRANLSDPTRYTPFFAYRPGLGRTAESQVLHCEDTALWKVADEVGTPAYVYSRASIKSAYVQLNRALGSLPHAVCYAVKANSNLAVLRLLAGLGSNFDIVSGGELDRLRRIGVPGGKIVFSGVGKTREEIRAALAYSISEARAKSRQGGIRLFNVESEEELDIVLSEGERHTRAGGSPPEVSIRINPDVLAGGHKHISTGHRHHKFGVDWKTARRMYLAHKNSPWIRWSGISAHLGSQILSAGPYRRALQQLAQHVRELAGEGILLQTLDIGGGLGIRYTDEETLDVAEYARALASIVRPLGCTLLIEPGRWLVGPSGVLLTRVLYVKENRGKTFVIVDAAMNDLIRPVLYDAIHPITPAIRKSTDYGESVRVDVVGPVCESGDFLARDYQLDPVNPGDVLVVWTAGAYGFVESSNYNARRRAAEVLVQGRKFIVARRRETYDDLVRQETGVEN
jgi:diaminopimelate decarboxylase